MLKVTYTETGLCLEYCPEPLELLLSDRVCMYVYAQRSITVQPMQASIPLPTTLVGIRELERFPELELSRCDRDWIEITLRGLWITEDPNQDEGVFVTELNPRLEQRLLRLWMLSQTTSRAAAIAHGSLR
ncbi:MAG: alr0857 family protein [Leptolyngbyaceae cyanobacterium]